MISSKVYVHDDKIFDFPLDHIATKFNDVCKISTK